MSAERLQKVLASAGIASRRDCEELISAGRVSVNGKVVTVAGTRVDAEQDEIAVDGQPIGKIHPRTYVMLHKPTGVVSTADDPQGRPTVVEMVDLPVRLFPVGRLDYDSEGLLLMTDDGELTQRLTHPSYQIEKEYRALLDQAPSPDALREWRNGVILEDTPTAPAWVDVLERGEDGTWVRVVLQEGRKRQIREVAKVLGYEVLRLIRVREGPILLGDLPAGQWRQLTDEEVEALWSHVGGRDAEVADSEPAASEMGDSSRGRRRMTAGGPPARPRARGAARPDAPEQELAAPEGDEAAPRRARASRSADDRPAPRRAEADPDRERAPRRDDRDDRGGYSNRGPQRDDRGGYSNRGPQRDDRGGYSNRGPQRDDRGGYSSRGPQRDDRGGYSSRGPQRDDRGGYSSRGPQRDDRGGYSNRGPQRDDRGGFSRGGQRDDRGGFSRGGQRDDRGGYSSRGPQRDDRGGFSRGGQRDDRGGYSSRGPQRDDRGGYQRGPRRDDYVDRPESYDNTDRGDRPDRGNERSPQRDVREEKRGPGREWHERTSNQARRNTNQRPGPGGGRTFRFGDRGGAQRRTGFPFRPRPRREDEGKE